MPCEVIDSDTDGTAQILDSRNATKEHNARAVEKEGGARVILERDFSPETLGVEISTLVQDKEKLTEMRHGAKRAGTVNATEKIYKEVKRLTGR